MSIQSIQLADLRPPAHNPHSAIEDAALDELAASIRSDRLLQNLVVAPSPAKSYRIVSGPKRPPKRLGPYSPRNRYKTNK